eukprot:CAMPEP_0114331850 /NCGR_PEP_ID=MMETSP0101-20121206/2692_1 /TAXON_ID=38822 ORGANISM="Pteridomonas danica, Strain PT" /NCGR_SAMPLE_ID=MMETSP0101 /ASSEMBLY_ACC=CAM_ASM_000211 /LENGTH=463 /DNA_ID=CAMNT_0001462331 /DNA_START=530 /DNA_END=1921 /DNA_ORIENTATION=+
MFLRWCPDKNNDYDDHEVKQLVPVYGMVHLSESSGLLVTAGRYYKAHNITVWNIDINHSKYGQVVGKLPIHKASKKKIYDIYAMVRVHDSDQVVVSCNQGKFYAIVNIITTSVQQKQGKEETSPGQFEAEMYAKRLGFPYQVQIINYIPIDVSGGYEGSGFENKLCSFGDTMLPYDFRCGEHLFFSTQKLSELPPSEFEYKNKNIKASMDIDGANEEDDYDDEVEDEEADEDDDGGERRELAIRTVLKARSFADVAVRFPMKKIETWPSLPWTLPINMHHPKEEEEEEEVVDDDDEDSEGAYDVDRFANKVEHPSFIVMTNDFIVGGYKDGAIYTFRLNDLTTNSRVHASLSSSSSLSAARSSSMSSSNNATSSWVPHCGLNPQSSSLVIVRPQCETTSQFGSEGGECAFESDDIVGDVDITKFDDYVEDFDFEGRDERDQEEDEGDASPSLLLGYLLTTRTN